MIIFCLLIPSVNKKRLVFSSVAMDLLIFLSVLTFFFFCLIRSSVVSCINISDCHILLMKWR